MQQLSLLPQRSTSVVRKRALQTAAPPNGQQNLTPAFITRCSADAIVSLSLEGVIDAWNQGAEQIFGYSAEEAIGKSIQILAPEDRPVEVLQVLKRVFRGEEVLERETVCLRKGGSRIAVTISVSPATDAAGMVLGAKRTLRHIADRKRADKTLRKSEEQYRLLFDSNPFPMWVFDRKTLCFLAVNNAAVRHYGFSRPEFLAMTIEDIRAEVEAPDFQRDADNRTHHLQEPRAGKHRRKDGTIIDVEIVCHHLNFQGVEAMLTAACDITERNQAAKALALKTSLLEAQSETTIDGILAVDDAGHILLSNNQFRLHFSIPEELHRSGDDRLVLKHFTGLVEDPEVFLERVKYLNADSVEKSRDEIRLKDGRTFDRYSSPLISANGRCSGRIWYFRDITEQKTTEARIQHLAFYDALTELPHRALFQDRLDNALAIAERRNGNVAVLSLDLDRFKVINDSYGHSLGDFMLKEVADRLRGCIRAQDTVARVGGDEFLVMLSDVHDTAAAAIAADRVMRAMSVEFSIQDHILSLTCSIGISVFPEHGSDGATLIKNAASAMHSAKEGGRNLVRFFTNEINGQVAERLTLETGLRAALEKDEFFLVYQPQVEVCTGRITGLEALIRWKHPRLGLVPPDKFIPIAEDTGLILQIGEWVLRTACAQAKVWHDEGLLSGPVAVNVSAIQFRQENFCALIRGVLDEIGLAPQYLELELTESLLLSNSHVMLMVLQELRNMGVMLAIDDFGTGYSSLSYLKQFRVNKLKIDRSFITDLANDSDDCSITAAIISMAKSLGLKVIAEGVETEAQFSLLREYQCDEIQGYYFSKPIPAAEIPVRLQCAKV